MPKIKLLDQNMINMIAAGEVIERPASVLKELMENSIDAGAKKITVRIEQGGRTLISVTDNGSGMDAEDLKNAFVPHATSKLSTPNDLAGIKTMGFRGEALASIAAVSQLKATSRTSDSIQAHTLEIDAGTTISFSPAPAPVGTTIEVSNLFYKLPARAKFLKTQNTEFAHISATFTRIALANPHLDLTLIHNGKEIHRLLADQPIRARIAELISGQIAAELIELSGSERNMEYFALIGHPQSARSSADYQYTFLNGRYIRDKFISHAIKESYRGLMEPNKHPVAFLFLTMPPESFDVNVHPTKIEVRFDNSNMVHSQVLSLLREKLLSMNLDAKAQFPPSSSAPVIGAEPPADPRDRKEQITQAMSEFFKNARSPQHHFDYKAPAPSIASVTQNLKPLTLNTEISTQLTHDSKLPIKTPCTPPEPISPSWMRANQGPFIQLHDSYIVAQSEDGFVIIDQHALHERIMYEELTRRLAAGPLESQRLLIPEPIDLAAPQLAIIDTARQVLEKLGIKLEPFGERTYIIQSFPAMLPKLSPAAFVSDVLDLLVSQSAKLDRERLLHEILDMTACKAAIKAGQKLTQLEIQALLEDKETIERASRCPHGRPTSITFSLADLEKQFKRT